MQVMNFRGFTLVGRSKLPFPELLIAMQNPEDPETKMQPVRNVW
jgi:hypothetical protein